MHTGLAVLESRWWNDGNDSVRPLFEVLCGITSSNPHAFRYDMFAEEKSFAAILDDICSDPKFHSVYIGAHGDDISIGGLADISISRTKIRNFIENANGKKSVSGIYFGSCFVNNSKNAEFWLDSARNTHLRWVAGYSKSVGWIDSSAVDLIFWSKYLEKRIKNKSRKKGKWTDVEMVEGAASAMKKLMPTVFERLGFNIYVHDSGGKVRAIW